MCEFECVLSHLDGGNAHTADLLIKSTRGENRSLCGVHTHTLQCVFVH